jgi:flagellin
MVGINSNLAAATATRNLGSANAVVQDSISRISSGNRIVKASDDVAGLSIGTAIKSTVTSLQVALLNTQQARSVLQIADGALSQINDILSRQKALATQANSGSLGATERGYLNQEFTSLTSEIDRIVGSTSFNGITLLNGSIAGNATTTVAAPASTTTTTAASVTPAAVSVDDDVNASGYTAVGTVATTGGLTAALTISLASFDDPTVTDDGFGTFTRSFFNESNGSSAEVAVLQTTINGKTYQSNLLTASANGGNLANTTTITFTEVGGTSAFAITTQNAYTGALNDTSAVDTLANEITTALANVDIFQNRAVTGLTAPSSGSLNGIASTAVSIRSNDFDVVNNDFGNIGTSTTGFTVVAGSDTANSVSITINGRTFNASDVGGANDTLAASDNNLILYGRDSLGNLNNERLTISLTGLSAGIDLTDSTATAGLQTALNSLFGITVNAASTTTVNAYSTVGTPSSTYVSAVDVSSFDDVTYQGSGFGTFSVANFNENSGTEQITLQTTLGDKVYVSNLIESNGGSGNIGAQDVTFTAEDGSEFTLTIAAVTGAIDTSATAATYAANLTTALADTDIYSSRVLSSVDASATTNTVLEGLSATSVSIKSNNFDTTNNDFGDVGSFSGVAGAGSNNTLSVVINGTTFNANDLGGANDTLSSSDSTITLVGRDAAGNDNNQRILINISGLTRSIDLTNQDEVDSLTNALNSYFGVTGAAGSGGLSFQVGASVSDSISISVDSVATTSIYKNDSDVYTDLTIGTQEDAQAAIGVLDNAIASVISRRADIGAATSRFNFASKNIEISISNQDAARGTFLDADIAEESTQFASNQVKLQASVAVLSQANKLPQNLLTLLQ